MRRISFALCRDMRSFYKHIRRTALVPAAALLLIGIAEADVQPDARPVGWRRCCNPCTITSGGVAQTVNIGGTAPLRAFFIQNPSDQSESLFFDVTGGTAANHVSPELQKGDWANFGPGTIFFGNSFSVVAATNGHPFVCIYGQ